MLVYVLGLFPFLPHVYHVAPDGEEPDGAPGDDPAAEKGQYSSVIWKEVLCCQLEIRKLFVDILTECLNGHQK